jgi:hypothetical protein
MRSGVVLVAAATVALALGLGACGEKAQVTVYKQGKYQGKPDDQPWGNPAYKGDQVAWEKAIKARTNGQNEYVRIATH